MNMTRSTCPSLLLALFAVGLAPAGHAAAAGELAPLPPAAAAVSSHAPFEAGECGICHERNDPKSPGAVLQGGKELCLGCHEDFNEVLARQVVHRPAKRGCTGCHNPHNAAQPKLLRAEPIAMCTGCHEDVGQLVAQAKVPHKAVTTGEQCTACHNPHGSAVSSLLVELPFDLCLSCHDQGGLSSVDGKPLQDVKAWLDGNRVWHGPVAKKDCGACHQPHGSEHFRLLKEDYPANFYARYDARNYSLCFSCHEEPAFSTERTRTLTQFRDGERNLHFVHLKQGDRGRSCRACHEVHASSQDHHIRAGVPYGSSGWILKLNYSKADNGGSCAKTCHQEKSYDRAR